MLQDITDYGPAPWEDRIRDMLADVNVAVIPPGTFSINGDIELQSDQSIVGTGNASKLEMGDCSIVADSRLNVRLGNLEIVKTVGSKPVFDFEFTQRLFFQNVFVRSNRDPIAQVRGHGVRMNRCSMVYFTDSIFRECDRGVSLEKPINNAGCTAVFFSGTELQGCRTGLHSDNSTVVDFKNGQIQGNADYGMWFDNSKRVSFDGLWFENNAQNGYSRNSRVFVVSNFRSSRTQQGWEFIGGSTERLERGIMQYDDEAGEIAYGPGSGDVEVNDVETIIV